MSQRAKAVTATFVAMALVFPLAGCAAKAKVKRSAKQSCEAHGGSYNAQTSDVQLSSGPALGPSEL